MVNISLFHNLEIPSLIGFRKSKPRNNGNKLKNRIRGQKKVWLFLLVITGLSISLSFVYFENYYRNNPEINKTDFNQIVEVPCSVDSVIGAIEGAENPDEEEWVASGLVPSALRKEASQIAQAHGLSIIGWKQEREKRIRTPDGILLLNQIVFECAMVDQRTGTRYEIDIVQWSLQDKTYFHRLIGTLMPRYDTQFFIEEAEKRLKLQDLKANNYSAFKELIAELNTYSVDIDSIRQIEINDKSGRMPGTIFSDKEVSFEVIFELPGGKLKEIVINSVHV